MSMPMINNNLTLRQKLLYSRVCWYWGLGAAIVLIMGICFFAFLAIINTALSFIVFIIFISISIWGGYNCFRAYLCYLKHIKEYHRVRQMCLNHPDNIPRSILYAWKRNHCMVPMAEDLALEFKIQLI
jgi:hypothetical protein